MGVTKLSAAPLKGHDELTSGRLLDGWEHWFLSDTVLTNNSFKEETSLMYGDQELTIVAMFAERAPRANENEHNLFSATPGNHFC